MSSENFAGYMAALATTLIWGLVVLTVRRVRSPGYLGVTYSMPAGIVVLLAAWIVTGGNGLDTAVIFSRGGLWLALGGVFQFPLATIFYYEVLKNAEISLAVPLTRLKAVFVVIIAFCLGMETITGSIVMASLLAVAGAGFLTWQTGASGTGTADSAAARRGIICALLASLSWAIGDIFIRLALLTTPVMPATIIALAWGFVIHLLALGVTGKLGRAWRMPVPDIRRFMAHGILSFGCGYYLFFYSMQAIDLTRAAIITSAWPLISCAAGIVLYRERLPLRKAIGVALIMASVVLVVIK